MYLLPAAHTHCYELRDGRRQAAWSHATAVSSQALKGPVLQPSDLWRSTARHPHMPHTARGRSGRIWPPAAGTFAHITDGPLGPAAISRPVTARRVGGRHRATSIASITLSYGRGQENA